MLIIFKINKKYTFNIFYNLLNICNNININIFYNSMNSFILFIIIFSLYYLGYTQCSDKQFYDGLICVGIKLNKYISII